MHFLLPRLKRLEKTLVFIRHGDLAPTPVKKFRPDLSPQQLENIRHLSAQGRDQARSAQEKYIENGVSILVSSKSRYCKETAMYLLNGYTKPIEAKFSNFLIPKINYKLDASIDSVDDTEELKRFADVALEELIKVCEKYTKEDRVLVFSHSLCITAMASRMSEILGQNENLDYLKTLVLKPLEGISYGEKMVHVK